MKYISILVLMLAFTPPCAAQTVAKENVRIKDLGRIDGWRDNQLVGYGIVTGLAGTGDSPRNKTTRQSIANLLYQFDLNVASDQISSRNVASVIVTSKLPPFARPGDKLDVTVTSLGDARSLLGGSLLITPLKGPDNKIYALAQGSLSIGGYKYDFNGNVVQKNHPTVGSIPAGANLEVGIANEMVREDGSILFFLADPDFTTADRIATSINGLLGRTTPIAAARDAGSVEIKVSPEYKNNLVGFMTRLESVSIQPDYRAKVVVNERTGTVISGGDVRISKVTVSHGDLKVSIITDSYASQPSFVRQTGPGVRTEIVRNSRIDVAENVSEAIFLEANNTVADLVKALNKIKTTPRDMISILQGIKTAGALHAELIIQ